MNNEDRLQKLKYAEELIREVEFSYPTDHPIRKTIYCQIVHVFSFMGDIGRIMAQLKEEIQKEKANRFVIVNGEKAPAPMGTISYAEVAELAKDGHGNLESVYTIVYSRGHERKPNGFLIPGMSVEVKSGMVFTCLKTGNS